MWQRKCIHMSSLEKIQQLCSQGFEQFSAPQFLQELLLCALLLRVSDVHIDPTREGVRLRFRVDGDLETVGVLPQGALAVLIARIKILASLRTDEHQTAQDGRFDFFTTGAEVSIRVGTSPSYYGERVVLRLLVATKQFQSLQQLGMNEQQFAVVQSAMRTTGGMILTSGPTGSGKTTTLYALLHLLQRPSVSIVTLEDPIEYAIDGVVQIPIHPNVGFTFAAGLRAVLRQDPDVILVGEIRDAETAKLAVNAALTGHMVLTSIHTTEALGVFARLADLGVEQYLLASTVRLVIAQRLVRIPCAQCATAELLSVVDLPPECPRALVTDVQEMSHIVSHGCGACRGSGFLGRMGVFELLSVTSQVREVLFHSSSRKSIEQVAQAAGMVSLRDDAFQKVLEHKTTVAEFLRISADPE